MRSVILGLVLLACTSGAGHAATLRVPLPYTTIQAALDASAAGDTIEVAPGIYTGVGNRDLTMDGDDILLLGAGPQVTIIDCQGSDHALTVTEGNSFNTFIIGFTFRNATSVGIQVTDSSPTFAACEVTGCQGGGMSFSLSQSSLSGCTISGNDRGLGGGGIRAEVSALQVVACEVVGNSSSGQGGGLFFEECLNTSVAFCVVTGNTASEGAGIYVNTDSDVVLTYCTVASNASVSEGGGIHVDDNSNLNLEISIVYGNCAPQGPQLWSENGSTVSLDCSDIDLADVGTGVTPGFGNVDVDPQFCQALPCGLSAEGSYELMPTSPVLNTEVCGTIGALVSGICPDTPVLPTTWGRLKARIR